MVQKINMNPKNPQVEKVISIDIKVLCDDGKERIFSIYDMVDVVKSDMSLSKDLTTKPRCKIGLNLHCDDYRWLIKEDVVDSTCIKNSDFDNFNKLADLYIKDTACDGQLFCGCRREDCENYKTEECRKCLIKHLNDMENN